MDRPQAFGSKASFRIRDDSVDCVAGAVFAPLGADQLFVSFGFVKSHEPRSRPRSELRAALSFEFSQALILVARLNCDPIVEAVELVCEVGQRLAGLLQLDAQFFRRHFGRRVDFPLEDFGCIATRLRRLLAGRSNSARRFFAELDGASGELSAQSLLCSRQLVAELDARLAERLAQPHHLGAEIVMRGDDASPIFRNLFRQKANLAADFRELSENLIAQRVEPSAETGNRLDHKIESRPELFEDCANPVYRFVRHLMLPSTASARSCRRDPICRTQTTTGARSALTRCPLSPRSRAD